MVDIVIIIVINIPYIYQTDAIYRFFFTLHRVHSSSDLNKKNSSLDHNRLWAQKKRVSKKKLLCGGDYNFYLNSGLCMWPSAFLAHSWRWTRSGQ